MKKNQFTLLMVAIFAIGFIGAVSAALETFDEKNEGKTGLKDMVEKLNTNFTKLGGTENIRIYNGTHTTLNLSQTTATNTFSTPFTAVPFVLVTVDGVPTTNVVTVASNQFTVVWGATNINYKYLAIGAK